MPTLPTVGQDTDAWGPILNDYLTAVTPGVLSNDRVIIATTPGFVGAPIGKLGLITYASTVHPYNLVAKISETVHLHLRRGVHARDYGARFDYASFADDAALINLALAEATSAGIGLAQMVWLPAGKALIGATLLPNATGGGVIRGEGNNATWLVLKDNFDAAVLSTATLPQVRYILRDLKFSAQSKVNHASTDYALLDLTKTDLGEIASISATLSPGDGVRHFGTGDELRVYNLISTNHDGHGFHVKNSHGLAGFGGDFETNGKTGLWIQGNEARSWYRASWDGLRSEHNVESGIKVSRASSVYISKHYSDGEASIYFDRDTYRCGYEKGTVLGYNSSAHTNHRASVYNNGVFNRIVDIDGIVNPYDDAPEHHWPGSIVLDPYEARTDATAWLVAGNATRTKSYSLDLIRFVRWFGRVPTKIASSAPAAANYAYKDVHCVAGESIDFYLYWYGIIGATQGRVIVRIVDDAAPTVDLYNSGTLTVRGGGSLEWGEERHWVPFRVPTGVTKLRFILQPVDAGVACVATSRLDAIASRTVTNPGFLSATGYAYAGGIANGWSYLSGTGTPSEETTIVDVLGKSSQKIVTTGGNSYFLSQVLTLDPSRFYQIKGLVYVPSGTDPRDVVVGFGSDMTANWLDRLPVFQNDVWYGVEAIVKPNAYTRLIVGLMDTGTAYFQWANATPLRDRTEGFWRHTSAELAQSGAATSYLFEPTIDQVITRVTVTYTVAGTGTVNVGVPGDVARFGTVGTIGAQWQDKELVLTRSDLRTIRPGLTGALPLQVSTPGGGTGSVFVTVEGGASV